MGKIRVISYLLCRITPWNWYVNLYIPIMVVCSLDDSKEPSKKKEMKLKKEIVEVLQQASDRKKRTAN